MAPTIYLIGASHARRLSGPFTKQAEEGGFRVVSRCTSGAPYRALEWPDLDSASKDDLVLVLPFGNDVNSKKCAEKDRRTGIWHLLRFEPKSDRYFQIRFQELKERIQKLPCRVFICENFWRLLCCSLHNHKNWLSYQNSINKQIFEFFKPLDNVTVIKHREIVGSNFDRKKAKNCGEYKKLQFDAVHFKSYEVIAQNLLDRMI